MDVFSPAGLPGVGFGDIASVAAIGALLGFATTIGAMIADRVLGSGLIVFGAIVLGFAGSPAAGDVKTIAMLVAVPVVVLGAFRLAVRAKASDDESPLGGAAIITWILVLSTAGLAGAVWSLWDEKTISAGGELLGAVAISVIGVVPGFVSADRFIRGSVQAGGVAGIVGTVVSVASGAANSLSFYVPFVGFIFAPIAAWFAIRMKKRTATRHRGLRILAD